METLFLESIIVIWFLYALGIMMGWKCELKKNSVAELTTLF